LRRDPGAVVATPCSRPGPGTVAAAPFTAAAIPGRTGPSPGSLERVGPAAKLGEAPLQHLLAVAGALGGRCFAAQLLARLAQLLLRVRGGVWAADGRATVAQAGEGQDAYGGGHRHHRSAGPVAAQEEPGEGDHDDSGHHPGHEPAEREGRDQRDGPDHDDDHSGLCAIRGQASFIAGGPGRRGFDSRRAPR